MSTVVAVFAHPDDEAFGVGGVLAAAAEATMRVVVVCATRGEAGEISDPSLATPLTLAEVREAELRAACRELGVDDVRFLGYRDSGMAGSADNVRADAFVNAEPTAVIAQLVRIFREVRADVVLTFEPAGGYGHPDHVTISARATEAFDLTGDAGRFPEAGPAYRPAYLYYAALPRSFVLAWADHLRAAGLQSDLLADAERVGVPDERITAIVDVSHWAERKRRAVLSHATQMNPQFLSLPDHLRRQAFEREAFILARGPRGEAASRFAGLAALRTVTT